MKKLNTLLLSILFVTNLKGAELNSDLRVNDPAPVFKLKTHEGADFDLQSRKGKWTVLYFFPKTETPGCTKQACSFRDNIKKIRNLNADVFGVSTDNVADMAAFHKNHQLNFTLLADDKAEVTTRYGSKMAMLNMSNRWTFIINPKLIIKHISRDVDPVLNSVQVAGELKVLQAEK